LIGMTISKEVSVTMVDMMLHEVWETGKRKPDYDQVTAAGQNKVLREDELSLPRVNIFQALTALTRLKFLDHYKNV
jgi:hypothetical protein